MTVIVWYFISTYAICPSSLQWQGELYAMKYEKKIKTVMVNNLDGSYQVSLHLAERFQRRLKCKKLTDDGHQVMAKAHVAFGKAS
jgi:hypothetical protein